MRKSSTGARRTWRPAAAVVVVALGLAACGPPPPPPPPPGGSTDTVTVGGQTVTVSVPDGLTVDVAPAGDAPAAPSGLAFPAGAFSISVDGVEPGDVVPVTMTLSTAVDVVRKLVDGSWDPFRFDGLTGSTLSADGRTVNLWLRDGGRGDGDGVADGRIEDPVAPATATALTITSHDLPFVVDGEPISVQLEAAGAVGPVTWSLVGGTLRDGLTLDPSGLLSGTPQPSPSSVFLRVQADDGTSTATKLLVQFAIGPPAPVTPAGLALPDGSRISAGGVVLVGTPGAARGIGFFEADGSYTPLSTIAVTTLPLLGISLVAPNGRWAVDPLNGGSPLDAETGEPVVTVDPYPANPTARFSPDGTKLAAATNGGVVVFDTATWTVVRSIPPVGGLTCCDVVWSPDSAELASGSLVWDLSGTMTIQVFSATDPLADRTLTVTGQACNGLTGWSTAGRLLLGCSAGVVSVAALDGSDSRVLAANDCGSGADPCSSFLTAGGGVPFSPSGSHVAVLELLIDGTTGAMVGGRPVIVADAAGAVPVPLTDPAAIAAMPISWR